MSSTGFRFAFVGRIRFLLLLLQYSLFFISIHVKEDDLEQVGVFEVKTHWDYNFQVGDLVARVTDFDYCQSVNENPEVLKSCYDILERRVGITLYGHEV